MACFLLAGEYLQQLAEGKLFNAIYYEENNKEKLLNESLHKVSVLMTSKNVEKLQYLEKIWYMKHSETLGRKGNADIIMTKSHEQFSFQVILWDGLPLIGCVILH